METVKDFSLGRGSKITADGDCSHEIKRRLLIGSKVMTKVKTLKDPLDWKEIQLVHPKGNQPLILIGRTDAEAEAPVLWPPDVKSWLTGKDSDAGKDWGQEEKRMAEDEMVGWHHWLNGHEFEQAPGVGDEQGGLVCCSPWGRRVWHDWATELNEYFKVKALVVIPT